MHEVSTARAFSPAFPRASSKFLDRSLVALATMRDALLLHVPAGMDWLYQAMRLAPCTPPAATTIHSTVQAGEGSYSQLLSTAPCLFLKTLPCAPCLRSFLPAAGCSCHCTWVSSLPNWSMSGISSSNCSIWWRQSSATRRRCASSSPPSATRPMCRSPRSTRP
ncbi:hypothetical protein D3C72_1513190 [compost metagenome]